MMMKVIKFSPTTQKFINNFLKEYQETEKTFIPLSGTGCKSNPKDQYTFIEKPLENKKNFSSRKRYFRFFEIKMLTIN